MRIEGCTFRVNQHSAGTEVFVSNDAGVNTVFYLPPGSKIDPAQPIEFVPVIGATSSKNEPASVTTASPNTK